MENENTELNQDKLNPAENMMATAKLSKLILRYSLPTIIGMLVNSLYNTVDRIWVGKIPDVGTAALTGIGLCAPIMNVILGLSMLVGIGAAANISICLGRKDREKAEKILGNCLSLILIISAAFSVLALIFAEDILLLIGARESTLPFALPYIRVILAGAVFNMTAFAMNHPIRATGNPGLFARTQLVGGIANTILDPIFIFVFKMGITGAAVATIISQAISLALVMYHHFSPGAVLRIRLKNLRIRWDITLTIFAIGVSPFLMQVMGSLIAVIANRSLMHYGDIAYGSGGGDIAIGAMTAITSVSMLFLMPVFGVNQGSQPIIGYNYGAKNYGRVREAAKWSIIYPMVFTAVGFIIIELFAEPLIYVFNTDETLVKIGAVGMRIFLSMFILVGFQVPSSNFFQAIGRAKISVFLSLLRQVILLIPAYLILPLFFGLTGVWMAGPLADFFAAAITAAFIAREMRILKIEELRVVSEAPG